MAGDRVLRVVLVGNSKSAVRAIGETEAATGSLGGKLKSVAGRFKSVGKNLSSAGKTISHRVTLPVVAAGVASMKMAADFDSAMTRIQTQAGASADDVEWLKKRVLDLSGKTQQSPLELADAMFHLKSIGLSNVKAMRALKESTDLAAVGNANLEETTNAVGGAWRTGIKGARNFHDTVKTLNAIIGAGNMKMEDLNGALGTGFLATARSFKLSLKDVGSALAVMTDEGIPARVSATRLGMSFSLLGAPSGAAAKAMREFGVDSDKLSHKLQHGGIVDALGYLRDRLSKLKNQDKVPEAITHMFGGGRSSSAIRTLLNNFDVLEMKEGQVRKGMNRFGDSVKKQAKTPTARFKLLVSTIEMLAVKIGNKLLPFAVKAADALDNFLTWASKLNPNILKMGALFIGLVAAAGPLLMIIGSIATGIAAVATVAGAITLGIIALAAAFAYAYTHSQKFRDELKDAFDKIKPQVEELVTMFQTQFLPTFKKILPILKPILAFIVGVFIDSIVGAIEGAIQVIKGIIQVFTGVVNLVDDLIHGRWKQAWGDLWLIIKGVLNIIIGGIKLWWNLGILAVFKHAIKDILEIVGKKMWKGIAKLFEKGMDGALGFVKDGWKYIKGDFSGGVGSIGRILGRVVEVITYPYREAFRLALKLIRLEMRILLAIFRDGPGKIAGFLSRIPGMVKGIFKDAGTWLLNAGKDLISGFIHGITSKFGDVKGALGGLTGKLTSWKGPPRRDKTLLTGAGQMVMDGFTNGLRSRFDGIRKTLGKFTDSMGRKGSQAARGSRLPALSGLAGQPPLRGAAGASQGGLTILVPITVEGNVIGEKDFAKRVVPTIRGELIKIGKDNSGKIFGNKPNM